jgi:hypothetical protein
MQQQYGDRQTQRHRRRTLAWLALVVAALGCNVAGLPVRAAEPPPPETPTEQERQQADPEAGTDAAAAPAPRTASPEVFVPSEEISEDFTVSFPVDI